MFFTVNVNKIFKLCEDLIEINYLKISHLLLSMSNFLSSDIVYVSLAHSPKSINRQRSLQNGRNFDMLDHSSSCLHVGHLTNLFIMNSK